MYKFFTLFFIFLSPFFSIKVNKPKLCINCKHFISNNIDNKYGKCSLFPRELIDDYLIDGNTENNKEYYYCSTARSFENMCGKEGKMYKKKVIPRNKK
jgi:hypothetical protein